MAIAEQPKFVGKILSALGLERVRSLTIRMSVNDITTVDVSMIPSQEQMDGVGDAFNGKRFQLCELADEPSA